MGIYMSSHAMIGVKFNPVDKEVPSIQRGCSHTGSDNKFCGECGAPMWKEKTHMERQFENIYEDLVEPVLSELVVKFNGFAVATWGYDGNGYYFGYGSTVEDHEDAQIPLIDYEVVRSVLEEVLTQYGIWDQCKNTFNLWVISTGH